jgi:ribosomal protein L28
MAYICDICGKSSAHGSSKKHRRGVAGKRWKNKVTPTPRLFKPNLQFKTLLINGEKTKMRICAKCIKRIKKYGSIRNYSNIAVL